MVLNNLQWLICHQTQPNQIIYIQYICIKKKLIGLVDRVFANGPGDLGSIPGCVIPKTLKMVLDTFLLPSTTVANFSYYKEDLALNNLQWLICHKSQQNQIIYI